MLSIPLIPPQGEMWHRPVHRPRSDSPPPANNQNPHQTHRQRQQRDEEKKQFNARSPLAMLAMEEAAITQRKAAVRNFGAYWIRPPGVPKTLQAMTEEEAERLEQAELERQERGLADMQAQQQLEEARQRAEEAAMQTPAGGEAERNLDDDIPEAEATTADVTFNEDSMMEGSEVGMGEQNEEPHYAELEEAELTGAARDEEELGIERDLDDSVPEAGSYQHTDTEVEDSDSDSELGNTFARSTRSAAATTPAQQAPSGQPPLGRLQDRMRAQVGNGEGLPRSPGSLHLSSSVIDSSFANSSPVARTNQAGRARGGRRRGQQS